ncbi:MAG: hypothetical protein IJI77_05005, partial [Erysipelotrichaceae bacterium]|nr:hypothetical protein [Erysipelotrichaceae bacterium]
MSSFKDLRIVDNFYQTSAFFPMPTVCISTVNPDGSLNIGSYSLCFPYYIAGKDRYAMLLECRNTSNTCQNLLRTHKCAINFIPDDRKSFKEAVRLGFPGPSEEKMKEPLKFTMEDGQADPADKNRPQVIAEAFQVFECTWNVDLEDAGKFKVEDIDDGHPGPYNNFNGITSKYGAHFILNIDKILMKERYYDAIVNGVKKDSFPPVPVDYGYRDSTNFWYTQFPRFKKPIAEPIPAPKEVDLDSIKYAANRCDPDIKFTDDALKNFVKVPRPFLKTVLNGCV